MIRTVFVTSVEALHSLMRDLTLQLLSDKPTLQILTCSQEIKTSPGLDIKFASLALKSCGSGPKEREHTCHLAYQWFGGSPWIILQTATSVE